MAGEKTGPREITADEARDELIEHLLAMAEYWANVDGPETVLDRVEGMLFSTLVTLDGGGPLPGYLVIPNPHPSDAASRRADGANYYRPTPTGMTLGEACILPGGLHEFLHSIKERREKARKRS